MSRYKIAVLGGGPGGYVAAIRAAQRGAKTVLVEAGELGGVCLNQGCIPTKTLLKSARVFQDLLAAEKFGIKVDGQIKPDWDAMQKRKEGVVRQLNSGVQGLLKQNGVEVVRGWGTVLDPHTIEVNGDKISADYLIIATGSSPAVLPIPGLQEALHSGAAVTSTGALKLKQIPERLVVVGGGVVGMEFAALFNSLGSRVTVLEKFTVLGSLDAELQRYMQRLLQKKGVEIYNEADIKSFDGARVRAEIKGESKVFEGDVVLVSLGRRPNVQPAAKLNLELERGAIRTDEHLQTSVPGVYAIGDVNGKQMLAHAASAEGLVAVENILGGSAAINYDKVPACIYTFPEVAMVGLTEQEAVRRGHKVVVGSFPLSANGKALAEGEPEGLIKIVADQAYGEVLGAHIIAAQATDLISEAVLALELEATVHELAKAIHPHPTFSEALMEAAHAALGQAIHLFKKQ